ncbi:MAG: phytanoyl-CoA dioxygenase family protein [Caldilineaceae bacterium]|nr:phytanoyl-CoA dioxygenase family protein [Caldilineaceae bacterium]
MQTNRTSTPVVDATAQAQFADQGYLILRNFLAPAILAEAQAAINALVDQHAEQLVAAGKRQDRLAEAPFPTRLLRLYEQQMADAPVLFRAQLHLAGLYPLLFNQGLLDIVETLLGGEIRLYPNYSVRPKYPDMAATEVLWHQDGGYTEGNVADLRMVNVWTPLVPARVENGCMQFIPGTHKLGAVPHERRQYYLEIAPTVLGQYQERAIHIELDPGDVVLFHNLLFHRGLPNHSTQIRWSADWRYQDATQPTLRKENGHLARSRREPAAAVQSAAAWANLAFT